MIDPLLDYYQRELTFIRDLGAEFADKHPKIAGRLRLDADAIEDPHVSRFIEASALLAARTRLKIDDEFPDVCQAILQTLYPHFLAPIPPIAIAQLSLNDPNAELENGYQIPRGAKIESQSIDGEPCRFRTSADATVWPVTLEAAEYVVPPLQFATPPWNRDVQAAIRLRFSTSSPKNVISQLNIRNLPFFLGGSLACSTALIDSLFANLLGVGIVAADSSVPVADTVGADGLSSGKHRVHWLSHDTVSLAGYDENESLLPQESRSLGAYRILTEFFACDSKFRFANIDFADSWKATNAKQCIEVMLFLSAENRVLQREFDQDAIKIGCVPMINLFHKRAEPIRLNSNVTEYRVIPSARGQANAEVFSIDRVHALSPGGESREYLPFFDANHPRESRELNRFWYAKRTASIGNTSDDDSGTDIYISIVDLDGSPERESGWTLDIETTCSNRERVSKLPFGGGQPALKLLEGGGTVSVKCITPPTPTRRGFERSELHWKLVSHLNLNHISLMNNERGAEALREILRLYNADDSAESRKLIDAIEHVQCRRGTARVAGGPAPGFCRGIEVEITVDEDNLGGVGALLFANVLDRFMGLYASMNSFTRTTVKIRNGEQTIFRGPPRAGSQVLL